jgi:hypothetical protein
MNYRDNFDEFGNLRESHSPWELHDLVIVAMAVLVIAALLLGAL